MLKIHIVHYMEDVLGVVELVETQRTNQDQVRSIRLEFISGLCWFKFGSGVSGSMSKFFWLLSQYALLGAAYVFHLC